MRGSELDAGGSSQELHYLGRDDQLERMDAGEPRYWHESESVGEELGMP